VIRVSRRNPCPVCKAPDWCGITEDGVIAVCMRVESERPAKNGGWTHIVGKPTGRPAIKLTFVPLAPETPSIDAHALWSTWQTATPSDCIHEEADRLGVSGFAWAAVGAVLTEHDDWAIPMHDGSGCVTGIRLRKVDGQKLSVRGSRAGVFLPLPGRGFDPAGDAIIVEGPTDTAAALTLGLYAIGRPSCLGQEDIVIQTTRRLNLASLTIVADNDGPGIAGGRKLADAIASAGIKHRLVTCAAHKDMRAWVRGGATRELVEETWGMARWRRKD